MRSLPVSLLALATLGNAPLKAPPAPSLDKTSEASAATGAALLKTSLEGMVLLPAGSFVMGAGALEFQKAIDICKTEPLGELCHDFPFGYELHAHTVHLSSYWIDKTEVTVAAYRRCVVAGECTLPTYATGDLKYDRPELPVTHVSWDDARKFCAFRGARLPTEAEWERAARGLGPTNEACKQKGICTGRRYPWGMLPNPKLANHGALDIGTVVLPPGAEVLYGIPDPSDGFYGIAPVGSFPDGATPEGVHDLAGNVAEWVSDYWGEQYTPATVGDPHGPPSGTLRVVRGGSYRHPMAMVRGASRDRRPPSTREPTIGFRCARDA